MADQLQIDLVFAADPADALAALSDIDQAAADLARSVDEAFTVTGDLAKFDASGFENAASALADAAGPAEGIAISLADAAANAEGIAAAADVDTAGADQLAASLSDAAEAAAGVDAGLGEGLTAAAQDSSNLSDAMGNVTASAADASSSVDDVAASLDAASNAAQETDNAISRVAAAARDAAENQANPDEDIAQPQRELNEELDKSGKLAKVLQDQFVQIVDTAHSVLPSVRGITTQIINAAKGIASQGPIGLATVGIAAGAATLLTSATQYKTATDTIVRTTGATGAELDALKASFDDVLRSSGKSMGELAQIFSQLNRDTGLTGDKLSLLTGKTASFLGATQASVGDVRTMTQVMKALGIETTQMVGFQEKLTAAQKAFGGSMSTILSQSKTAGPALATLGFDPGQIVGLVAQLDAAGLAVQRLVPGFTKLAKEATQHGSTAEEAFGGLIERIKGADSATAALNEVQGIFSGRVAQSFVTAVRNGTISIEQINEAMRESPGIMSRLGAETKGIVGQFAAIRNELGATLGPAGEGLLEGIRVAVEQLRPSVSALIKALGELTPAFIGFGQALAIPIAALRYLERPLDMLAAVLGIIPEPLLKLVGIFAAMRLVPFVKIGEGIFGIATSLTKFTTETVAATTARLAFARAGDFSTALTKALPAAAGPVLGEVAASGGALAGVEASAARAAAARALQAEAAETAALETAKKTARSAEKRVSATAADAAQGGAGGPLGLAVTTAVSLGMLGITLAMDAAAKKADELKRESEALGKALGGLSIVAEEAADPFRKVASDPSGGFLNEKDLERLSKANLTVDDLRKTIVATATDPNTDIGANLRRNIVENFGGLMPMIQALAPELAKDAEFEAQTAGWTEKTLNNYIETGYLMGQRVRVAEKLESLAADGLKEANKAAETDIARLRGSQELTKEIEAQALKNLGLKDVKGDEAKFLQEANRLLAEQLLLKRGIATVDLATDARHAAFLTALSEEGLLAGDIAHNNELRTKSSQAMNEAMRDGVVTNEEWVVINDQMTDSGFTQEEMVKALKVSHEQLQAIQAKYPVNTAAMDTAMTRTFQLMGQGFDKASALSQAAAELGVDMDKLDGKVSNLEGTLKRFSPAVEVSDAALAHLQRSMADGNISKTETAELLSLVGGNEEKATAATEKFAAGVDKTKAALDRLNPSLGETASTLSDISKMPIGPDAAAQKAGIEESAAARSAAIDAEIADLEALKAAEGADTAGLQARIDALKEAQAEIDSFKERSLAAVKVFDEEMRSIRGVADATLGDIDSQIGKLQTAKARAQESAAARGVAFDPAALDAQIDKLLDQRNKVSAETEVSVAQAQAASGQVNDLLAQSQNGMLAIDGLFSTWESQINTQGNAFKLIAQLEKQGLEDTIALLIDPEKGLSREEIAARLQEVAGMSPAEQTALERHAEEIRGEQERIEGQKGKMGDLFAKPNPAAVTHAEDQGKALGKGITDGFVKGVEDGHFVEIIDGLLTGQSPQEILEKFKPKGAAAATGFQTAAGDKLLEAPLPIEAAKTLTDDINRQLGVEGTNSGVNFATEFDRHLLESPLPIETATAHVAPANAQLTTEGGGGGFNWRGGLKKYVEENPLPASTADAVVAPVNGVEGGSTGLWAGGWAGGQLYKKGLSDGVNSGSAFPDGFTLGESLVDGGNAGAGVQSPSYKGYRTGQLYVEGLALGVESAQQRAVNAATKVGEAVASAIVPAAIPVGIDSAAIAAATSAQRSSAPTTGATVNIGTVQVTGSTNASADEVAAAMARKIGFVGVGGAVITGRNEL